MGIIPRDVKFVGKFVEDRNGKKIVEKWERVIDIAEHNAEKDTLATKILAEKLDESVPVGRIEVVVDKI